MSQTQQNTQEQNTHDHPVAIPHPIDQLVQLATVAGRYFQSSQTGFIHYYERPTDETQQRDTIPLYENFLFALALLRNHKTENRHEGIQLLTKLLAFQVHTGEQEGTFPIYLHEYPNCRDPIAQIRLLPLFFFLLHSLPVPLHGSPLDALKQAATRLAHALEATDPLALPIGLGMQWAAAFFLFGKQWHHKKWTHAGEEALKTWQTRAEDPDSPLFFQPKQIADVLVALQMLYPNIQESPWHFFWTRISDYWHTPLATYVGPHVYALQKEEEPEATLYDLYMGYFSHSYSRRAMACQILHLQGALVQPSPERLETPALPFERKGTFKGRSWLMWQHPAYACAVIQKCVEDIPGHGFTPFVLYWGDLNTAHSLICSGQGPDTIDWTVIDGGLALLARLPEEVPNEAKQRNRELSFYVDQTDATWIEVGAEKRSTVFQMGEMMYLRGTYPAIQLQFGLHEGDGHFFGHVHPGNRPAQSATKGKNRFSLFDKHIFLRTLHRQPDCALYACITWQI